MKNERGQALVILAFALIALLASVGLAIDGGRLYTARRQAQNTADAVAMAGTRLLGNYIASCSGTSRVADDNAIAAEMIKIARDNGIDPLGSNARLEGWYVNASEAELGRVGWGAGVPNGATGIRATLATTDTATFLKIVGQRYIVAKGRATAMTGPVYLTQFGGGGLLPIGYPVQRVDRILATGDYRFKMFEGNGNICDRAGVDCPSNPPAQSQRGWLNFNYIYHNAWFPNPSASNRDGINVGGSTSSPLNRVLEANFSNNDLKYWAEYGAPHPIYVGSRGDASRPDDLNDPLRYPRDGDFIVGDPGTRDVTRRTICEVHMNQIVYLPLFDYVIERNQMQSSAFFRDHEPANPLGFPNKFFYHIVGFIAASLDDCGGGGSNGYIEGTFRAAFIGEGAVMPGQGYNDGSSGGGGGGTCNAVGFVGVELWR